MVCCSANVRLWPKADMARWECSNLPGYLRKGSFPCLPMRVLGGPRVPEGLHQVGHRALLLAPLYWLVPGEAIIWSHLAGDAVRQMKAVRWLVA
jgi:hypothetical protein